MKVFSQENTSKLFSVLLRIARLIAPRVDKHGHKRTVYASKTQQLFPHAGEEAVTQFLTAAVGESEECFNVCSTATLIIYESGICVTFILYHLGLTFKMLSVHQLIITHHVWF